MLKCRCIFFSLKFLEVYHVASSHDLDTINLIFCTRKKTGIFFPNFLFHFVCFQIRILLLLYIKT